MRVTLHVDIYAPDEELAKTGECYGSVFRELDISFVPFVGLVLNLASGILEDDPRVDEYSHLADSVSDWTMLFEVKKVIYDVEDNEFRAYVSHVDPTLEQFHSFIEFLTAFHGFEALC